MRPSLVLGSGFWVLGSGFWVLGSGFWVLGSGFWILGAGYEVLPLKQFPSSVFMGLEAAIQLAWIRPARTSRIRPH
ncbi:MAG: phosphotransferase [Halieaceae bacterium MED-G27]|nr:MAG: phosphotransferase [Halieaceae bacterium MED-G27]